MKFENLEVFKMAMRNTNIAMGREVDFMKNDKARVRACCVEKKGDHGCQWKIYYILNNKTNTYQVMTYDPEYTCTRRIENKLATREWVAEKLIPRLKTQPDMSVQQVFEFFIHTYQVKFHDAMVFRATKLAKQKCEVEVEYTKSWKWFLQNLISDVGDPIEKKYTFIFDMQKGLDAAMKEVCDGAPHIFFNKHIWANLTKHAKCNSGEPRRAFWNCGKATTP
ncbi:hypothetical protein CRG98_005601 [Punica granatum]|uniref:Transposase MuDR plant domain-containing protein n=1 Tax=Punica granatum TaxID=22663 RepID=A0A2I0KZT3_PUNGR|nr:hypothetical protein CRG98_005601 [Punica granatum]